MQYRIAIMDEGQIIALGTLEQLLVMRDQKREVQRPHGLQELFIQLTGKHYATNCPRAREQFFINKKKENIYDIYTTT